MSRVNHARISILTAMVPRKRKIREPHGATLFCAFSSGGFRTARIERARFSCALCEQEGHLAAPSPSCRRYLHLSCDRDLRYRTRVVEHSFTCPFCGEEITMVLDLSVHRHTYVEDCEVCCNPLEISYTVEDEVLISFEAKSSE